MGDNFLSVCLELESLSRSSHLAMKPPKLPGAEKFKFSDRKHDDSRSVINSVSNNINGISSNFMRGIPSRSTCPPTALSAQGLTTRPTFSRHDSRRRPILPLSSRMTSRFLTLTSHLPLDAFDIRDSHSCHKPSQSRNNTNIVSSGILTVPCVTATPTITSASRVSLFSESSSGSHSSSSSQPSPRSLCSPLDRSVTPSHWAKNAHRLSTSSQSSFEEVPETCSESIWISPK